MLRDHVGTDTFWTGIRKYYAQYRDATATTADLQRVFEETRGSRSVGSSINGCGVPDRR